MRWVSICMLTAGDLVCAGHHQCAASAEGAGPRAAPRGAACARGPAAGCGRRCPPRPRPRASCRCVRCGGVGRCTAIPCASPPAAVRCLAYGLAATDQPVPCWTASNHIKCTRVVAICKPSLCLAGSLSPCCRRTRQTSRATALSSLSAGSLPSWQVRLQRSSRQARSDAIITTCYHASAACQSAPGALDSTPLCWSVLQSVWCRTCSCWWCPCWAA